MHDSYQSSMRQVLASMRPSNDSCVFLAFRRHVTVMLLSHDVCVVQDNTLIVTGSSDKNIKIWGMDFGDCHRSIFAHDDSIMALQVSVLPVVFASGHRCCLQEGVIVYKRVSLFTSDVVVAYKWYCSLFVSGY